MVDLSLHERCLIVAPSWVGDMVMAQGLFKEIKTQNPEMVIDVLAPAWCADIIRYMPQVNELIEAPFAHGELNWSARKNIAKDIHKRQYDLAYVLPNSLKSALVPWLAKIPLRIGFVGEQRYLLLNKHRRLNKKKLPRMLERFIALARPWKTTIEIENELLPELNVKSYEQNQVLEKFSLHNNSKNILGLCPGAEFGAAKQWPVEHYAAVARYYLEKDWQVLLFGSDKDQRVCSQINDLAGEKCLTLAGQTSLSEAVALLSATNLVISNDSGLMHVAAALHKPLVAVYGSTDPGFTPPLNKQAKIVKLDLSCSPCFKRECPLGHLNCLVELKPNIILQASKQVLSL